VAVAAVIFIVVSINRANEAATEAKLASPDQSVRDSVVLQLAMNNHLIDALSNTQDPNTNSDSPQNTRSKKIYSDSANSMNRLIDSGRIPDSVAFSNLFMLYKDGDSKTGATLGLAKLAAKSDANRHYLVQRLADGDPDVRNAAVDSLSFASGPDLATSQTASEVVKLIKNTSAQDSAESALNKIGKPSVPYLLPYIDDADLAFREQIVTMLGTIGSAEAAPDLIRLATANPPNPPIRRLALVSLAQIVLATIPAPPPPGAKTPPAKPDPVAVAKALSAAPVLTAALNNPSDDSLARSQSALALGRIASLQAVTALVGALGDLDSRVRQFATDGIQAAGPVAVPALAEALKSANGTVRASAASALGGIGNPAALSAIKPALADPQVDVRMAAAQGMGASANTSSIPMLVSQLSDTSGFVAGAASNALVVIGDPAVPSLIAALGSPSQATCLFAAEALQHIGNPAVPPLIRAAQSGSQGQKTWSAVALGRIHDPQSKPVLQELAASANPSTRWAAQQALQQFSATES
jgi:HEAT repeat protein